MYCTYFGFSVDPFTSIASVKCVYSHKEYQTILDRLRERAKNATGIVCLLGASGIGKSTLLNNLGNRNADRLNIKDLSSHGRLSTTAPEHAITGLVTQLRDGKFDRNRQGEKLILLLDDADDVSDDFYKPLLNEVAIRNADYHPTLLIVAGTTRLDQRINSPLFQAHQNLLNDTLRMVPLDANEVENYILYRLKFAGYAGEPLFTKSAIDRIAELTRGIPRNINTLCGSGLLLANLDQFPTVNEELINTAANHCFLEQKPTSDRKSESPVSTGSNTAKDDDNTESDRAQSLQQIVQLLNQPMAADSWPNAKLYSKPKPIREPEFDTVRSQSKVNHWKNLNLENPHQLEKNLDTDPPKMPDKDPARTSDQEDLRPKLKPIQHIDIRLAQDSVSPIKKAVSKPIASLVAAIVIILVVTSYVGIPSRIDTAPNNQQLTDAKIKPKPIDRSEVSPPPTTFSIANNPTAKLTRSTHTTTAKNEVSPKIEIVPDSPNDIQPMDIAKSNSIGLEPKSSNHPPLLNSGANDPNINLNERAEPFNKTIEILLKTRQRKPEKQPAHRKTKIAQTIDKHKLQIAAKKTRSKLRSDESIKLGHIADRQELATKTRTSARYQLALQGIPFDFQSFIASAAEGKQEIVNLFLDANMPVNAQDQSDLSTALIRAAANGHYAVSTDLLKHGANVNIVDANGWDALMHAANNNRIQIVKKISVLDTDRNTKDATGKTALSIAKTKGYHKIVSVLQPSMKLGHMVQLIELRSTIEK